MIAGCGALGNEVAKNLAQIGIGEILLVDRERVEIPNLAHSSLFREEDQERRKVDVAKERLEEINPDVKVRTIHGDLLLDVGLGVLRRMDLILGCLDNRSARLWLNQASWKVCRPWINGGIQELLGTVEVFIPPEPPCYECSFMDEDYRLINLRYSCYGNEPVQGVIPTLATISSIIGGIQAQEAIKILHGLCESRGKSYTYDGMNNISYESELQERNECTGHTVYDRIVEVKGATPAELLNLHSEGAVVELDREIWKLSCRKCNLDFLGKKISRCPDCGSELESKSTHLIRMDDEIARMKFEELGIPPLHIIAINNNGKYTYYEVNGNGNGRS